MSILLWTAVVLIGGAGSALRFLVDGAVQGGRDYPLGTLAVNVSGAVILGLLTGLVLGHDAALLAGTAAVGSYTTFSTWMLETQRLTEERQHGKAALNVAASLAAGVAAAALGQLMGPARSLTSAGLVTVEGARLLADTAVAGPDEATKLTVYLGRQERVYRVPAFVAVCDLLHRRGVDGATALLGVDGTAHGRRQRAAFFSRNAEVPMMIIAVGAGEQIGRVLPELGALLRRPLLTLERVRVCKRDGRSLALPGGGPWQKLMVYTSETVRHQGQPVHRAIVRRLRSAGLSGATTLRGIWGFHGDHAPHGDRLLQLGRHVPTVTIVIDTPERIARAYPIIDELTSERGLVTCETISCLDEAGLRAQARR
jgi:protein CrcB